MNPPDMGGVPAGCWTVDPALSGTTCPGTVSGAGLLWV
jgi:hypothetical protein